MKIFGQTQLSTTPTSGDGSTIAVKPKVGERPVCVVVAVRGEKDAFTHLALLAISSQPSHPDRTCLEVPEIECRRGGLSALKRAWISVDEYNYDIAEHSYYLDMRQEPLGRFSKQFMIQLASAFVPFFKDRQARVPRAD